MRVASTLATRYAGTFFFVPLLGITLPLAFSPGGSQPADVMKNFLLWYIPFVIISFMVFWRANPNKEKTNSKMHDQAVLIIWGYNRFFGLLLSILFITVVSNILDTNISPYINVKTNVLRWYFVLVLVVFVVVIFFRGRIFEEKANQLRGQSRVDLEKLIFTILILISFLISFVLFPMRQNDPKLVIGFSLSIVVSFVMFFIGITGFHELVVIWDWRKQNFWDKETASSGHSDHL